MFGEKRKWKSWLLSHVRLFATQWSAISFSRVSGEKWFTIYLLWIKSPKCFQKQHYVFFSLRALCRLSNSDSPANHFSSRILKWKDRSSTKVTDRKCLSIIRTSDRAFEVIRLNVSHALLPWLLPQGWVRETLEKDVFFPFPPPREILNADNFLIREAVFTWKGGFSSPLQNNHYTAQVKQHKNQTEPLWWERRKDKTSSRSS